MQASVLRMTIEDLDWRKLIGLIQYAINVFKSQDSEWSSKLKQQNMCLWSGEALFHIAAKTPHAHTKMYVRLYTEPFTLNKHCIVHLMTDVFGGHSTPGTPEVHIKLIIFYFHLTGEVRTNTYKVLVCHKVRQGGPFSSLICCYTTAKNNIGMVHWVGSCR